MGDQRLNQPRRGFPAHFRDELQRPALPGIQPDHLAPRGLAGGGDPGEPGLEALLGVDAKILQRPAVAGCDRHEGQRLQPPCPEPGCHDGGLDHVGASRQFQKFPKLVSNGGAGQRMQVSAAAQNVDPGVELMHKKRSEGSVDQVHEFIVGALVDGQTEEGDQRIAILKIDINAGQPPASRQAPRPTPAGLAAPEAGGPFVLYAEAARAELATAMSAL